MYVFLYQISSLLFSMTLVNGKRTLCQLVKKSTKIRVLFHKISPDTSHPEDQNSIENVNFVQSWYFWLNMVRNLTRAEIAAIKLPKVLFIPEKDVLTQMTELDTSDPVLAMQHPLKQQCIVH